MTGIKKITYDFSKFDIQKKLIEIEMKKLPKEEPITEEVVEEQKEKVKKVTQEVVVVSEKTKKDPKLKKLREKQLKAAIKSLEKVIAKLKKEKTELGIADVKFQLQLRESNLDTGVKG